MQNCNRDVSFFCRQIFQKTFLSSFFRSFPDRVAIVPISQKDRIRVPFDSRATIWNAVAKPGCADFFPGRPRLVVIILIVKRGGPCRWKATRGTALFLKHCRGRGGFTPVGDGAPQRCALCSSIVGNGMAFCVLRRRRTGLLKDVYGLIRFEGVYGAPGAGG